MLIDSLVSFVPIGAPINLSGGTAPSNVVDLLGLGSGVLPSERIVGQNGGTYFFGEDSGIGGKKPQVQVNLGSVAPAGGTSLNIQFQGAPDTSTGVPGTWVTYIETGTILLASLSANLIVARFDFPPSFPANAHPRFLRLNFVVAGTFTAGTISSAIVTMDRDDYAITYQAKNFIVGAVS